MKFVTPAIVFATLVLGFYLLKVGASFFIPLVIAIVIWYLIISLSGFYQDLTLKSFHMPHWLAITLSIASIFLILSVIVTLVNSNIKSVIRASDGYNEKIHELATQEYTIPGTEIEFTLKEFGGTLDFKQVLEEIGAAFGKVPGYTGMILIFTIFLLLEYKTFNRKIHILISNNKSLDNVEHLINKINDDIQTYLKIKSIASLITASLSYIVLSLFGIEFASFWALLIFLLNYIPTIGSIIAVFFVSIFAFFDSGSLGLFLALGALLIIIQVLIGGIMEPRYLGKSLNLSPLAILLFLALWKIIWGVTGMFLCVPIMVIINIILANFESTRPIAILLSSNGRIAMEKPTGHLPKIKLRRDS